MASDRNKRERPRKDNRTRRPLLKIRAIPLVRMPKSVFFKKIREACHHGIVPNDIEITTLNWDHAEGNRYVAGMILNGKDKKELKNCYELLVNVRRGDVRFERPS